LSRRAGRQVNRLALGRDGRDGSGRDGSGRDGSGLTTELLLRIDAVQRTGDHAAAGVPTGQKECLCFRTAPRTLREIPKYMPMDALLMAGSRRRARLLLGR
jgi:hypothetical protein